MTTPLSVLIVEDSEDDLALIVRALQRGGYDLTYERVETAAAMSAALDRRPWDIVIADHNLPRFSAPAALTLVKDRGFDMPFIIVSGAIGEDIAVAAMKAGAQDYIMKNNLARLVPAIERELREAADRHERQRAETALSESEERFRIMADTAPALIWMAGPDKFWSYFNKRWLDFTGRTSEQEKGYGWMEGLHRDDFQRCFDAYFAAFAECRSWTLEYRLRHASGQYRWILETAVPRYRPDGSFCGYIGSGMDITERKRAEAAIELHADQQAAVADIGQRALAGANPAVLMDEALVHMVAILDIDYARIVEQRRGGDLGLLAIVGWQPETVGQALSNDPTTSQDAYTLLSGTPIVVENLLTETRFKDTFLRRHGIVSGLSVVIHGHDQPFGVISAYATTRRSFTTDDIHFLQAIAHVLASAIERKRAEAALTESQTRLSGIIGSAMDAIISIDSDQRITVFNAAAERMFRYASADMIGQSLDRLIPERFREQHRRYISSFDKTGYTRRSMHNLGVVRGLRADGEEFPIEASISVSEAGGIRLLTVIMRDISLRLRHERALETIAALTAALRAGPAPAALPEVIVNHVAGAVEADSVALAWRRADDRMEIRAAYGQWSTAVGTSMPIEGSSRGMARATSPQSVRRLADAGSISVDAPRAQATIPLIIEGQPAGMLWAGRDGDFADDEMKLLVTIGDLAAIALENAELRERQQDTSEHIGTSCATSAG